MTSMFKTAMLAATQLTAAGSLTAATAAIQRALAGELPVPTPHAPATGGAAARAGGPRGDTIDIEARWLDAREEYGSAQGPANEARPAEPATGRMLSGTHTAPAGTRDYLLYLPPQAASASSLSLVVMLHGCTQTPADFAAGTGMNKLADQHGFIVLYPGQNKSANQNACWNWFNPRDQRADAGEPSIIAGIVREVLARYPVDATRVHVAGLSAGGAMAAILADAYPDLVAAVAVHSGLPSGAAHDLPSALNAMKRGSAAAASKTGASGKPVRTIVFHGRQVVDAALAGWPKDALTVTQDTRRSPGGRSYTRTVHAGATGRPMVEQWEVQGAGHAWSGGHASGSYTDAAGPDASAEMMRFFLNQPNTVGAS